MTTEEIAVGNLVIKSNREYQIRGESTYDNIDTTNILHKCQILFGTLYRG